MDGNNLLTIAGKAEGTDFKVDYKRGLVMALNASTAGAQDVSYTPLEITDGYRIDAATNNSITCRLLLVGKNLDDSHRIRVVFPKIELSPDGEFDFFSSDFAQLSLTGTPQIAEGETSPMIYTDLGV